MDPIARMVAAGAAGVSGSSATYVDDVFSTTLYTGNASSNFDGTEQVITTGIDHTEGFLTWIKNRDDAGSDHVLFDSERTGTYYPWLYSNKYDQEQNTADIFKTPTSTGFTVKAATSGSGTMRTNPTGSKSMVSWNFRKAPGFFDVVAYTGSGANRSIAHSLGSVPGCILIKCTSRTGDDWIVYHRSTGNTKFLNLNQIYGASTDAAAWNSSTPTSSVFYLGTKSQVNSSGESYVAYIFAHDEQSFGTNSDEAIIKCGQFEATDGTEVNLGFEPQWVLAKRIDGSRDWFLIDNMRGMSATSTSNSQYLSSNDDDEEKSNRNIFLTPTGFTVANTTAFNYDTHIYIAIRRPHKPPEAGTEVFAIDTSDATSPSPPQFTSGFVTDFIIRKTMDTANNQIGSRLQGTNYMSTYSSNQESSASALTWDFMDGWSNSSGVDTDLYCYMFKRAPGFMDVVAADYPGSSAAISHNLDVAPELIISKPRDGTIGWMIGSDYLPNTNGWDRYIELNSDASEGATTTAWNQTAPTATHFTLGNYPGSSYKGIFYLFASLDGISKVGSYTGTGSAINVDCGFTAGARFVMIKRTDSSGNWFVFDTDRGITSSSSPWFALNYALEQQTGSGNNFIDPYNTGFTVDTSISALNANGGTYLFLAIA